MLTALHKLWKRMGALGVGEEDQSAHERRRIAVLNYALTLGVVVSFGYAILYVVMGSPGAAVINAFFIALYSTSLALNAFERHRIARHLTMLGANAHMLALVTLVLGVESGVHRWYWMFIVITFLVFTRQEKKAIYGYAALSIGLYAGIEHDLIHFGANPVISKQVASVLSVTSTIVTLTVITIVVDLFDRETGRAEKALAKEHQRSESLLLNILPSCIATRLKDRSEPIADAFPEVTVLFADIAGFTTMSDALDPHHVVALLNEVFSEFDQLAEKHGLEKIKTIGDAYMVAGGLPTPRPDHAKAVAAMALDMVQVCQRHTTPDAQPFKIRIGINTGPVVAGVIGVKKFIYDLWGDTVNTASRMESHGVIGAVQVSAATARLIEDEFELTPRGEIEIKGKGAMKTYLLEGRKALAGAVG